MIPIHRLLARIRWDRGYAGHFELGYYDRLAHRELIVPFEHVAFAPRDRFAFTVVDDAGEPHRVPYHRVRAVYRNGRCIWRRPPVG